MELFSLIKEYARLRKEHVKLNNQQAIVDKQLNNSVKQGLSPERIKELEKQKELNAKLIKSQSAKLEASKAACKREMTQAGLKTVDAVQEFARQGTFIHAMLTGSPDTAKVMQEFLEAREVKESFLAEEQNNQYVKGIKAQLANRKPGLSGSGRPVEKDQKKQMLDEKTLAEIKRKEEERRMREQQQNLGRKR